MAAICCSSCGPGVRRRPGARAGPRSRVAGRRPAAPDPGLARGQRCQGENRRYRGRGCARCRPRRMPRPSPPGSGTSGWPCSGTMHSHPDRAALSVPNHAPTSARGVNSRVVATTSSSIRTSTRSGGCVDRRRPAPDPDPLVEHVRLFQESLRHPPRLCLADRRRRDHINVLPVRKRPRQTHARPAFPESRDLIPHILLGDPGRPILLDIQHPALALRLEPDPAPPGLGSGLHHAR